MVDWSSSQELNTDSNAFSKLIHVLFGLYLWEFAISFNFDLDFILLRKKFKWPLFFYFAGRYSLLFALIGIIISLNVTVAIDCQALYVFNQVFGNSAIGFASINLSLRTMAVWSQSMYIVIPLILVILGHWSLLLHGLLIDAAWVTVPTPGCVITKTDNTILAATFIYSMAFDFTVLCLTAYKLVFPRTSRSRLVSLIFGDGLIFFIVAFLANLIATVFMLLNLNAVMSIIFNVPAAIASTIVASRAVRRLTQFTSAKPDNFTSQQSALAFRGPRRGDSTKGGTKGSGQIHMNTLTMAESSPGTASTYTDVEEIVAFDAAGNLKSVDLKDYDPEAQVISGEFKRPPYCD